MTSTVDVLRRAEAAGLDLEERSDANLILCFKPELVGGRLELIPKMILRRLHRDGFLTRRHRGAAPQTELTEKCKKVLEEKEENQKR